MDKVGDVRVEMRKKGASVLVVTALDEVAWLLNLRGSDIEYNPVFFAYIVITLTEVRYVLQKIPKGMVQNVLTFIKNL